MNDSDSPALIADATDPRFVLGLGVSHPPVNKALGIDMGDAPSALRRYVTAVCLTGPLTRCREQLAAFRSAGVDMPILVAPIGVDGARAVIKAFRR